MIARIPISFLEASNANTWSYVLYAIKLCVEEDGRIVSEEGQSQDGESAPAAGSYLFVSGAVISFRNSDLRGDAYISNSHWPGHLPIRA